MYSRNPWEQDDPTAPNYGAANYGQLQPQDAPAAPQGPPGYQQPPSAWQPQARMFQQPPAPQAPVQSGRDAMDPTRMTGPQAPTPTSQGGLAWSGTTLPGTTGLVPGKVGMNPAGASAPSAPPAAQPPPFYRVPDHEAPPPDQWSGRLLMPGQGPPPPDRLTFPGADGTIPDVLRNRPDPQYQAQTPQAPPPPPPPTGLAPTQGMGPTPTGYNPPAPPEGIPNDPWKTADPSKLASNSRERALVMGQVDFTGPGRGGAQINPMAFRGFNDERALSAGDAKSAKDAFRDFIGQTDFDVRGLSKPETGEFLASKVVPFLESKGYPARVKPGEYDIIEVFSNERGWEPIDVIQNAGSAEAAWQWGDRPGQAPQGPASGALNPDLLQQAAAGAGPEELAMAQSLGIDTNNPLWRQMFEAWFSNQESVDPASFGLTPPPGA